MQKSLAQQFKVKLDLIKERETMMSMDQYEIKEWFPNYIILCKPIYEGMDQDSGNEWNGLLRQIEKGVKKQIEATS
jgi:hypothetical protein